MSSESFTITAEESDRTVAAVMRQHLPGRSWSEVRRLIETRHVRIGKDLCLDPARRVHEGDIIDIAGQAAPKPRVPEDRIIRYLDEHIVVAEKPAGMNTVRHPAERSWTQERRQKSPTLDDILPGLIAAREGKKRKGPPPRLRVVQRLDKETSGLVVFARTPLAQRELARQFFRHTVVRRYLAVVEGYLPPQRIATRFVRDRGDGLRGSTTDPAVGKEAITHVEDRERLRGYTVLECRLETGRTHQIRIHLAEQGHPVCGDPVYFRKLGGETRVDRSGAPRLALHAAELGFTHPTSGELLHWLMPLPQDLDEFLTRLRGRGTPPKGATEKER